MSDFGVWVPSAATRLIQKSVYRVQDTSFLAKSLLVTAVALIGIGLFSLALLNKYELIKAFSHKTNQILFGVGGAFSGVFLTFFLAYHLTRKYVRFPSARVHPDYQFLSGRPQWLSSRQVYGRAGSLRQIYGYQNWFTFIREKKDRDKELDQPHVRMDARPDLCVQWEGNAQKIFLGSLSEKKLVYQVDFPEKPTRLHYPFLKGENLLFVVNQEEKAPRLAAFNLETAKTDKFFALAPGKTVSLIRCCDDVVIVGYRSGFIQLMDYQTGALISSFQAGGEILDSWVDKEQKRLIIFSDCSKTFLGERRRSLDVWQF